MDNVDNQSDLLLRKEELRLKRLKIFLDFAKFVIAILVVYLLSSLIERSFREREVSIHETDQMGRFLETAINKEVWVRKMFAEYFSTITRDPKNRELWKNYYIIVSKEFNEHKKSEDSLKNVEIQIARTKDSLQYSYQKSGKSDFRLQSEIAKRTTQLASINHEIFQHRKETVPTFQSPTVEASNDIPLVINVANNRFDIAEDIRNRLQNILPVRINSRESPTNNKTSMSIVLRYSTRTIQEIAHRIQGNLQSTYDMSVQFDNSIAYPLEMTIK